jgi:hypothetical protein
MHAGLKATHECRRRARVTVAESGQKSFVGGDGPHEAIPALARKWIAA